MERKAQKKMTSEKSDDLILRCFFTAAFSNGSCTAGFCGCKLPKPPIAFGLLYIDAGRSEFCYTNYCHNYTAKFVSKWKVL